MRIYPSRRYKAKRTVILLIDYKLPETRSAIARDDRPNYLRLRSRFSGSDFRNAFRVPSRVRTRRARIGAASFPRRAAATKRSGNNCLDYSIKMDVDKIAPRGNDLFIAADASPRYRGLLLSVPLLGFIAMSHQDAVRQNYTPKVTFKWNLMRSDFPFTFKIFNTLPSPPRLPNTRTANSNGRTKLHEIIRLP